MILGEELDDIFLCADRTKAIILLNGKCFESDINHQYCLEEAVTDFFSSQGFDLTDESDMDEAIEYTDKAFRNNQMFGFDVFESATTKFLIAHYPQNLEDEECYNWAKEYAVQNDMVLCTFNSSDKLSDKCVYVY